MEAILIFLKEYNYWVKLGSIPIIAGCIGWITNWQAIKMTFKPLDFIGLKIGFLKLGWQGIIPANSAKMAGIGVDMLTEKLLKIEEIFERIDAQQVATQMLPEMRSLSENVVNNVMEKRAPAIWKNIPKRIKNIIFERTSEDIPKAIVGMLEDVKTNHEKLLNFKKMYIEALLRDKGLLNEIFMKCGKPEFKFIIKSGWWFGLLFGIVQMLSWHYYPAVWTLPVAGVVVGYATNWLALKLIFKPEKEIKIFFWKFQGLFIKRQKEVSEEYATIVTTHILTSENIWEFMLNENGGEAMYTLIEKHVEEGINSMTAGTVNTIGTTFIPTQFEAIKSIIIKEFTFRLPLSLRSLYGMLDRSFDLKNLLTERMQSMSPKDFVGVLRPAFEEEEWILISVGAVLGGLAGFAQWAIVFGGLL